MYVLRSCSLCVLAGCLGALSPYGDEAPPVQPGNADLTTDGGASGPGTEVPEAVEIRIDSMAPAFGSNGGGVEVTLTGSFDDDTVVSFGGFAGTVSQVSATRIVVTTPASFVTGPVDVLAQSADRTDTLTGAFNFFADRTGETGAMGTLSRYDVVGGYWSNGEDFAGGEFAFVEGPSGWEVWRDYTQARNTCEYEYLRPEDPLLVDLDAAKLTFTTQDDLFFDLDDRESDWGAGWYGGNLRRIDVLSGLDYSLESVPATADWPGFGLPDLVRVPDPFEVTTPVLDSNTAPTLGAQIDLGWTGTGGDYMVLYILRTFTAGDGSVQIAGWVTCAFEDDGQASVPASVWPDWYPGDFLHIQLGRVRVDARRLPHDNSTSRVGGISWVYGGAYTL